MEAWGAGSPLDLAPMAFHPTPLRHGHPKFFRWPQRAAAPQGLPTHPQQGTTPQDDLSTSRKLQPRFLASREVLVGGRRTGRWPVCPLLKSRGTKDRIREASHSACRPAHSGFPYRFYRSALEAGRSVATSHSLQIGSGRARLEKLFTHTHTHTHTPPQPQVEILYSSQDGPQSKHWAGNSISFVRWVMSGGSLAL